MTLPAYVNKSFALFAQGIFNRVITTGINTPSLTAGIVASTTHSVVGGTPLTTELNVVSVAANAGDAVTLAAMSVGQAQIVFNTSANALSVYPAAAGVAIDAGSPGAAVTLSPGRRCVYTCIAAGQLISAQLLGAAN